MRTHQRTGPAPRAATLSLLALALCHGPARAGGTATARVVGEDGILLRQAAPGRPWQLLKGGDPVPADGLVIGVGGVLESADGAARVEFYSGIGWPAQFPVMEAGVSLKPAGGADLAFALDRGRVGLTNTRKEGPARVRLVGSEGVVDVTLTEPGTHAVLERYGRYPAGTRFHADRTGAEPTKPLFVRLLAVTKGAARVEHRGKTIELSAPPGPALVEADDLVGGRPEVARLERLPDYWMGRPDDPAKARAVWATMRELLAAKPAGEAGVELTRMPDEALRRAGLMLLAATDDLPRLGEVLATTGHADVARFGVMVLRNWLGRAPGQDRKLYDALVRGKAYGPTDAETVIDFLHGFSTEDLARPEVYQTLIDYLDHPELALRVLSHWHLVRLVPAGRSIHYDPRADGAARRQASREWRKLLPEGKLPRDPSQTPTKP